MDRYSTTLMPITGCRCGQHRLCELTCRDSVCLEAGRGLPRDVRQYRLPTIWIPGPFPPPPKLGPPPRGRHCRIAVGHERAPEDPSGECLRRRCDARDPVAEVEPGNGYPNAPTPALKRLASSSVTGAALGAGTSWIVSSQVTPMCPLPVVLRTLGEIPQRLAIDPDYRPREP